ncbi:MAG: radical SAM family heme chaperone HemW [Bacteroidota bacterium]|nr:radical SAM family heme chaperone HemW [Bacteroidota bacterium]
MAGIYIHIPFCRRKCFYCNFFSVASTQYRKSFLEGLAKEIHHRRDYLEGQTVSSIYLGGGTPSLLETEEIGEILNTIRNEFIIDAEAEITIEVNPDDVKPGLFDSYNKLNINRISIGIQSFFPEDLTYLNRIHSAEQAYQSVKEAFAAQFQNISIDLIYGIPGLGDHNWEMNLEKAFELNVPHVSAYALTVEPKTPLDLLIRKGTLPPPEEEDMISQFKILMEQMRAHGYDHYEISNFGKKGFYSRHNSMYWTGGYYLGLGPSAHSYNGKSRQWNAAGIEKYLDQIRNEENCLEIEVLTPGQKYDEYVMVSLRTQWGCDLEKIRNDFGPGREAYCLGRAEKHIDSGDIEKRGSILFLTGHGKLFADAIASDLFTDNDAF